MSLRDLVNGFDRNKIESERLSKIKSKIMDNELMYSILSKGQIILPKSGIYEFSEDNEMLLDERIKNCFDLEDKILEEHLINKKKCH